MIGLKDKITKHIKTFQTTTPELQNLALWLKSYDIKKLAIESTGVYWKPVYNVMENDFDLMLVNPKHIKNIPGKKTDVKDAEWICKLLKHGLLRPSFIPPKDIREFRDFIRLRKKYTQQKTSAKNRIIKYLECANIKLKSIASSIEGVSSWAIVKAIANGQTNPQELARLANQLRASKSEIIAALTGFIAEHDIFMIQMAIKEVEFYNAEIAKLDSKINEAEKCFEEPLEIVRTFPGIGEIAGVTVIAEIGTNMEQFPTPDHLTSWAGLVPGNNESAGKMKSARTLQGNTNLKVALVQASWSAVREKDGYWNAMYYRLKSRLGAKKSIIAIARKILKMIHVALTLKISYQDLNLHCSPERIEKAMAYYIRKLEELAKKNVLPA
jgi:transposase